MKINIRPSISTKLKTLTQKCLTKKNLKKSKDKPNDINIKKKSDNVKFAKSRREFPPIHSKIMSIIKKTGIKSANT